MAIVYDFTNIRQELDEMARRKRGVVPVEVTRKELNDRLDDLIFTEVKDNELHPHRIDACEDAFRFMMAGNARVTFVSKATGNRFTFRVRESNDGKVHFVSLLRGANNETDYAYFGYIRNGDAGRVFFHGGQKAKVGADAQSVKAFGWVFRQLQQGNLANDLLEIWHEGRCGRCGRALTVPESIARGIGPECAEKMGIRCE